MYSLKKCIDAFCVLSLVFLVGLPILWGSGLGASNAAIDGRPLYLLWSLNIFISMIAILWLPIRYRQSINKLLMFSDPDKKNLNVRFLSLLMVLVGLLKGVVYLARN